MSGTLNQLQVPPVAAGAPPGGPQVDMPEPRLPGRLGTPGGGGTPAGSLGNALAPAGPQVAPGPGGTPMPGAGGPMPSGLDGVTNVLQKAHGQAKAMFENTTKNLARIDAIRKGLERLSDKGDVVTTEDIIEEAGKLVGHGIDPNALAGLLADMPQEGGGEALGGWVATHAITAAAAEQQLLVAHNVARHQMGVAAMHAITANDAGANIRAIDQNGGGVNNQLTGPAEGDTSMSSARAIGRRFMEPQ